MGFNPRSDIVQEVMNAADPSRASLAAERLAALGQAGAADADFSADLARAASAAVGRTRDDARPSERSRRARVRVFR